MKRRQYLWLLSVGAIGGFSGCLSSLTEDSQTNTSGNNTDRSGKATNTESNPDIPGEVELPISTEELHRGASQDAIPAITKPQFGPDWSDVSITNRDFTGAEYQYEPELPDDSEVIGVDREGGARAYPLSILNWHEIVNDDFHGPLLVTFCPLCGSGVTAERTVNDEVTIFGVSGLLWNSDLVMYDRATESLWSQILATAIRGPKTGDTLTLVPSTRTTWGAWREEHPETEVLLPPPISGTIGGSSTRDYNQNPYVGYESNDQIGIGFNELEDDRLHPKAMVIGVVGGDVARAYHLDIVTKEGVINDEVGGRPIVVTTGPDDSLVAYVRSVDGQSLTFSAADGRHISGGGSRWRRLSGKAVDGPFEGQTLTRANERSPMFWFAWVDFHPETELYGQ